MSEGSYRRKKKKGRECKKLMNANMRKVNEKYKMKEREREWMSGDIK